MKAVLEPVGPMGRSLTLTYRDRGVERTVKLMLHLNGQDNYQMEFSPELLEDLVEIINRLDRPVKVLPNGFSPDVLDSTEC